MTAPVTREYLESQSDRIDHVLASHRVPARVAGGAVTSRRIRYQLAPGKDSQPASIDNLSEKIAQALGAPEVRVLREGGFVALEVPRPDAGPVYLLDTLNGLPAMPAFSACLGLADDGRPLLVRLPAAEAAHLLIAGLPGSGKTELARALIVSLALTHRQAELQIALIDSRARGFAPLAGLPHLVAPSAVRPAEGLALLERLSAEMEARLRSETSAPRVVLAVDELLDLLPDAGSQAAGLLTGLARRGQAAGLHLVAATRRPESPALASLLQAGFPARLVGRMDDPETARLAAGIDGSGALRLIGRGDFVAVTAGRSERFQAAWIPPHHWSEVEALLTTGLPAAQPRGTRPLA